MFRRVLLMVGLLLLTGGAVGAWMCRPCIPVAVLGAVLVVGLLFERYVYQPVRPAPAGGDWRRTPERFADPNSGQPVVVYFNPRTGERRYVAE